MSHLNMSKKKSIKETSVKEKRTSKRSTKKRKFFHEQSFEPKKRRVMKKEVKEIEEVENDEEIRERYIDKLTNIFREYINEKLEDIDLSPEREKTRVTGLIKNFKNSIEMENKVYVNNNGYLVTSSKGNETYTVKQKAIADKVKYVCNCGDKYEDYDRTSCKHCGAMMFHNFNHFITDYLTKKPTINSMNLQMHNMQKNFNKIDIEKTSKKSLKKSSKKSSKKPLKKTVKKTNLFEKEDYFKLILGC